MNYQYDRTSKKWLLGTLAGLSLGLTTGLIVPNVTATNTVQAAQKPAPTKVNKSRLVQQLKWSTSYQATNYTLASFAPLQRDLSWAKWVLATPSATQGQVDWAVTILHNDALKLVKITKVDRSGLQQQLRWSNSYQATNYTQNSFAPLQQDLTTAQGLLNNPTATQSQLNTIAQALHNDALNLVNLGGLKQQLAWSTSHQASASTPYSFGALQRAITGSQQLLANPNATQAAINATITNLHTLGTQLQPAIPSFMFKTADGTTVALPKYAAYAQNGHVNFSAAALQSYLDFQGDFATGITDGMNAGKQTLFLQTNQADIDNKIVIGNLTAAQNLELSQFAVDVINQVRAQIGSSPLIVTPTSQGLADQVAQNYNADNWDAATRNSNGQFAHDRDAIGRAQLDGHYADGECISFTMNTTAYQYDIFSASPNNMAKAKLGLLYDIALMLYDDADSNYGHTQLLLGLEYGDNSGTLTHADQALGVSMDKYGSWHYIPSNQN